MDNFNQQGAGTRQPQNSNGQQPSNRPNMNRPQGQPMSNRPNNMGNVQQRPAQNPNQQYSQRPQQGQNRQQPQQRPVQQQQNPNRQYQQPQQAQQTQQNFNQQYGQPQVQQQQAFNQQNNNYGNMNQNQNFQQQPQQNNQYQFSDNVGAPDNKLGKISLVLGILSLCCCGIFTGIPALITSSKARKQNPDDKKAKIGKVLGIINIVLTVIATIAMIILVLTGKADFHTSVTGFDGVEHNYEYDAESGSMVPEESSSDSLSNIEYDSSVNNEATYETESNNDSLFTAPEDNTTTNEAPERPETAVTDNTLNESTPVEENTYEVTVYESNADIIAATGVNFESVKLSGVDLPVDNSITMKDLATYTGINFGTTLDEELEGLSYNYVSFTTNNYDTLIFYACNPSEETKKIGDCIFFGVSLNCNSSDSLADWVEFDISGIINQNTPKDYFTETFGVSDEVTTDENGTELYEYHTAFNDHKNLEIKYNADGKMTGFTIQNFPEELF